MTDRTSKSMTDTKGAGETSLPETSSRETPTRDGPSECVICDYAFAQDGELVWDRCTDEQFEELLLETARDPPPFCV